MINTLIAELPNNLIVNGSLFLNYSNITKLPDKLTIGRSFHLEYTDINSLPENFTVFGDLSLSYSAIKELPEKLTVGGYLNISNTDITKLPDNLKVNGDIDLCHTNNLHLHDNLTVTDSLILINSRIKKLPNNLTVGDYLELTRSDITELPDNLTVVDCVLIDNPEIVDVSQVNRVLSPEQEKKIHDIKNMVPLWEKDGVRYIKADGIFSVIDSYHGNVYCVHKIGEEDKPLYLITDGEGHWSHGATLAEAKSDLIYKINDRDTSYYKNLSLDDMLSFKEAIVAYRSITGACSAGTRDFIENRLSIPYKEKYTIREIIKLTNSEYGGEKFAKFFK